MWKIFICFSLFLLMTAIARGDDNQTAPSQNVKKLLLNDKIKNQLIGQAIAAQSHSYSSHSNGKVGAALLTSDGIIYRGSSVETDSEKVGCCAECAAIVKAISEGSQDFIAIAIVGKGDIPPCETCRLLLHEFASNIIIINGDEKGILIGETSLAKLIEQHGKPG